MFVCRARLAFVRSNWPSSRLPGGDCLSSSTCLCALQLAFVTVAWR